MLRIENITKSFDNNLVIDDFNLEVNSGEIVAIVGKSGTGKTTLLRIINDLEKVNYGTIAIDNDYLCMKDKKSVKYPSISLRRNYQNKIGMVFQDYALFSNLNVLENLLEAPLSRKVDTKQNLKLLANKILIEIDLADKMYAMPDTLSGGQKQRVAIARALMLKPLFLCFDEPTSSLDDESIKTIVKLIKDLAKKGTGILIITHNLKFAKEVATRTINSQEFKGVF